MRPRMMTDRPRTARDARKWRSDDVPPRFQAATAVANAWATTPRAIPTEVIERTRISQSFKGPFRAKKIVVRANTRGTPMAPTTSMVDQGAIPASASRTNGRTYADASANRPPVSSSGAESASSRWAFSC